MPVCYDRITFLQIHNIPSTRWGVNQRVFGNTESPGLSGPVIEIDSLRASTQSHSAEHSADLVDGGFGAFGTQFQRPSYPS